MQSRPTLAAFKQGELPTIACFNRSTADLRIDFDKLISAMQKYVDKYVAPVWGTPAKLVKTTDFKKGAWAMVFLDDADDPEAEAYHDLTPEGLPQAKVFVKTVLDGGDEVSIAASHELVEMLVDPATNLMTTGPDSKLMYAYESADPVEDLSFNVDGVPMSNFVFPAYFEDFHKARSIQFDAMNKVSKPFQILKDGYLIVFKNGRWVNLTATTAKKKALGKEDRRGHRSEQRKEETLKTADAAAIKRARINKLR